MSEPGYLLTVKIRPANEGDFVVSVRSENTGLGSGTVTAKRSEVPWAVFGLIDGLITNEALEAIENE